MTDRTEPFDIQTEKNANAQSVPSQPQNLPEQSAPVPPQSQYIPDQQPVPAWSMYTQSQSPGYIQDQPAMVPPQPQYMQNQPAMVPPQSQYVQGQPAMVPPQPQYVQGQPAMVPPQPQYVQGQPAMVPPQPQNVQSQPTMVPPQSQYVQGQPVMVPPQPQYMQGNPSMVPPQPQYIQGQPVMPTMQPQYAQSQGMVPPQSQYMPGQQPVPNQSMYMQGQSMTPQQPQYRPNPQMMQSPYVSNSQTPPPERNTESFIGKNVMGIAASILIFIGLVLFAKAMAPNLTDVIKISAMYLFSAGFTAFGLLKFRKNPKNTFYLSLGTCGTGALYFSHFLTYSYFHAINDIVLFIGLLVWMLFIMYVSRIKDTLFYIIGETGLIFSVIFGADLCTDGNYYSKFLVLTIYFTIGSLALWINPSKSRTCSLISAGCSSFALLVMVLGSSSFIKDGFDSQIEIFFALALQTCYCVGIIIMQLLKLKKAVNKDEIEYAVVMIGFHILIYITATWFSVFDQSGSSANFFILMLLSAAMYALLELFGGRTNIRKIGETVEASKSGAMVFCEILLCVYMAVFMLNSGSIYKYAGLAPIAIGLVIYGFFRNDRISKTAGVLMIAGMLIGIYMLPVLGMLYLTILSLIVYALMYHFPQQYDKNYKNGLYVVLLIGFSMYLMLACDDYGLDHVFIRLLKLILFVVINSVVTRSRFIRDWTTHTEEKGTPIVFEAVHIYLMFLSVVVMMKIDSGFKYGLFENNSFISGSILDLIAVLTAAAVFTIGSKELFQKKEQGKESVGSLYFGIRMTCLLIAVLINYEAISYVTSIAILIFSIVCIAVGFHMNSKNLRLYGLIVSMICIVKLIVIDTSYSSTLSNAIGFLASGILCFAISAVYNYADKEISSKRAEKERSETKIENK